MLQACSSMRALFRVFSLALFLALPAPAAQESAKPATAQPKAGEPAKNDNVQKAGAQVKPATMGDLKWLAGTWFTTQGKDELTEVWTEPVGNHMAGVFSWVKAGKAWMDELVTITDEGERIVFRLRHFDDKMVPWEEKDGAYTFPMVSASANEAVFESFDPRFSYRFTFKSPSPDRLLVSIASSDPVKTDPPRTFEFTRKK